MDKLPVELVTRIINYIPPHELATLQLVSRQFYELCRDNSLWRMLCFKADRNHFNYSSILAGSITLESSSRGDDLTTNILNQQLAPRGGGGSGTAPTELPAGVDESSREGVASPISRSIAQWDPSYEGEKVNWYSEYVARHAPLSIQWLQEPYGIERGSDSHQKTPRQIKGMGILKDSSYGGSDQVVGPLDDGSVCLWDLSRSASATCAYRGGIVKKSPQEILFNDISNQRAAFTKGLNLEFIGVGECVSIDSFTKRAYIAVGNLLNEVDLNTFKIVSQQRYAWSVFALSQETEYHTPLTIATTLSLNLYDSRTSSRPECENYYLSKTEEAARVPTAKTGLSRLSSPPPVDNCNFSSLFQPGPLSVLHPPPPNINSIIVAGRFPSILLYDRRNFPRLQGAVHSGARLCSSTVVPTAPRPYSLVNPEWENSHTIFTCGEYKGRGSLELFTLSATPGSDDWATAKSPAWGRRCVYQNRQSASRSKLLSVASHGTRIVYSDADGYIKWVERDGRTEVRKWNINQDPTYRIRRRSPRASYSDYAYKYQEQVLRNSFLHTGPDASYGDISAFEERQPTVETDVVRKILPTGSGDVPDDELLLWTGERIGRLRFAPWSGQWENEEEFNRRAHEVESSGRNVQSNGSHLAENRQYEETVQQSLQAHRNELTWMGDFGIKS